MNNYNETVNCAATTNIVSLIVLALGICCALFVNVWIGAFLCLAAELVATIPSTKLQNAIKKNNVTSDKTELRVISKDISKEVKASSGAFKFSFVIMYLALICVIVFALLA